MEEPQNRSFRTGSPKKTIKLGFMVRAFNALDVYLEGRMSLVFVFEGGVCEGCFGNGLWI